MNYFVLNPIVIAKKSGENRCNANDVNILIDKTLIIF